MQFSSILSALAIFVISASASSSTQRSTALQRCNPNSTASTCSKAQYCLAAKPHSYCTKKLEGGKWCTKDDACKSNICFIAKGKDGMRVCASLPLSDYPLGAQCTQSKQCKSGYCGKGFCKKPVAAGESCSKDVACAEKSKGAYCLKKAAAFVVYDTAGKKQTKKLGAGRCSYVRNLGEGMACSSNANCYSDGFTCNKTTNKCTSSKPPVDLLNFRYPCTTDDQCKSAHCVEGRCGCKVGGHDCDAKLSFCKPHFFACTVKAAYGAECGADNECKSSLCADKCLCVADTDCPALGDVCNAARCETPPATNFPYSHTCEASSECASGICGSNNQCACTADSETTDCSSSQYCDVAGDGVCADKLAAGASCLSANVCMSDSCQQVTSCPPGSEELSCITSSSCACSAEYACPDDKWCDSNNTCQAKYAYGGRCLGGDVCQSAVCTSYHQCGCTADIQCGEDAVCDLSNNTCLNLNVPYAAPCARDFQCLSNGCVDSLCACRPADCTGANEYCSDEGVCKIFENDDDRRRSVYMLRR